MVSLSSLRAPSIRQKLLALSALCVATLAIVWAVQLAGFRPCTLCLRQRWPYTIGGPALLVAALLPSPNIRRAILLVLLGLFGWSLATAVNQSGAEWGWWSLDATACSSVSKELPRSVEDFRAALSAARGASCAEPAFRVAGLSLANLNVALSFFVIIAILRILRSIGLVPFVVQTEDQAGGVS